MNIREIEAKLSEAQRRYHETGDSPLTDDEYDVMLAELEARAPHSPVLKGVGYKVPARSAVVLPQRMGSLEKKRTQEQLDKILTSSHYVLSDKLDGQSALLHALPDTELRMYSRGDGTKGRDLTRFVASLDGVPVDAAARMRSAGVEFVRGELVAPKSAKGSLLRNFVTGVINSNNPSKSDLRKIRFVVYETCGFGGKCASPQNQLASAAKIFPHVVHHGVVQKSKISAVTLADTLLKRKAVSEYNIDGVVVKANQPYAHENADYPSNAFAFKSALAESGARTTVLNIEWRVTRHGRLAPTLVVDPVVLNGSTVARASGKSARTIIESGTGVGAVVELAMAGDVIPDVRKVVEKSGTIPPPPCDWKWDANGVHYMAVGCDNAVAKLTHLFKTLPVDGAGESTAEKIADEFPTALAILKSGKRLDDLLGGTRGTALRAALKRGLRTADRATLAYASGVFADGIGKKTIRTALESGKTRAYDLVKLGGIGTETAPKLESGLTQFFELEAALRAETPLATVRKAPQRTGGPTVVFSGFRSPDFEKAIERAGGTVASSVTAKTDYLVTRGDVATGKADKAVKLGVPIVSEAELISKLAL